MEDPAAIGPEVGEPDVPTAPHVIDAAARDARAGHISYTSSIGALDLRTALAAKVEAANGPEATSGDIIVTHGAMSVLAMAMNALTGPGDEILLPDPELPNWRMAAVAASADERCDPPHPGSGFVPTLADIEASITPQTRVVVATTCRCSRTSAARRSPSVCRTSAPRPSTSTDGS